MKLLTKELEKKLIEAVKTNRNAKTCDEHMVLTKFFYPAGYATYFVSEYHPEDRVFFGYAILLPGCGEWGYFSRDEVEGFTGKFGLGFERDLYFKPCLASECKELKDYQNGNR